MYSVNPDRRVRTCGIALRAEQIARLQAIAAARDTSVAALVRLILDNSRLMRLGPK